MCSAAQQGVQRVSTLCGVQVFRVLGREGVNVKMMSQGASKTNISLIVADEEGKHAVRALHREFFERKASR
jgi:aspartate kinase